MPQRTLQEFRKRPATQIVSLGQRCATAYNIHRYFNARVIFPFDWWFSTAWGIMGALQSHIDVDFIYDPAYLELTTGGEYVKHRSLHVLLVHEFPRVEADPARPVVPNYLDYLPAPRSRTSYLARKLFSLNRPGQRILFIRGEDQDARLAPVLDGLFPHAEWTLAGVMGMPATDAEWRGDPLTWDTKLGALGVTLDRADHVS